MSDLVQQLKEMPLEKMGDIFNVLATRVHEHRLVNNGRVPTSLFLPCVSLSGLSVSFHIDNEVVDEEGRRIGWAMKLRESDETGFAGLYHNTCCVGTMMDTDTSGFDRDTSQAFGCVPPDDELELLGSTIHYEPKRMVSILTEIKLRKVTLADVKNRFVGTWRIFSDAEIHQYPDTVVVADCYRLEWVMDPNRPRIADIRGGWWPGKHLGAPRPLSPA